MTEELLEQLMFENYTGWEDRTLFTIGKMLKDVERMTPEQVKAISNVAYVKGDFDAVMKDLAESTGKSIKEVTTMYARGIKDEIGDTADLYNYRGVEIPTIADDRRIRSIIVANAKASAETMYNITTTKALGFTIHGRFQPLERAMENVLGRATLEIQSGASGVEGAVQFACQQLGDSGALVNYGSGVVRSLDSVVRQNVMYGMKNMFREYNALVGEELDCDGIEVDYHSPCRPSHEFMQGKMYAKGKTVTVHGETYLSMSEPDPASPDGLSAEEALNDYGCLHYATDVILGVSEPAIDRDQLQKLKEGDSTPIEIDGKSRTPYEWTQSMRGLERLHRKYDRQAQILKGAGRDTSEIEAKMAKVYGKYQQIEKGTGIKGFPYRFKVY